MLFVPLTTATMDPIPKEEMGNATSMFNLMRNLGGGFGIASGHHVPVPAPAVPHPPTRRTRQRVEHANAGIPQQYAGRVRDARRRAAPPRGQAYGALWGVVQRQASMLAFVDTFRAMAIVFLLVLPFLFIMRRPTHTRSAGPMH